MKIGHYDENEVFESSRACIKHVFNLELSLIEQCELKSYVRPILEEINAATSFRDSSNCFNPSGEVIARFMMDYYGLPFDYAFSCVSRSMAPLVMHNLTEFRDYLKILQERAHKL